MNTLFIGVACTDEAIKQSNQKYYANKSTVRPQQYFDYNLVCGLSEHCNVTALSEPPVASYPRSKCLWYKRKKDVVSETLTIKYVNLINLLGIKTLIIFFSVLFESFRFCNKNIGQKSSIVLGYLSFYTSLPAIFVAKLYRTKIFVIVPDIPKHLSGYSAASALRKCLSFVSEKLNSLTESNFDGYVFLTKYMDELLNKKRKPFMIMEGFINTNDILDDNILIKEQKKILMYAGTLHKKFGVNKLVEAFKLLNIENSELWIYGEGDCLKAIQDECQIHNNIKYKGTKNKKEILELEKTVTLLVNPRPSDEEFTKYSFPSKTIEYMASGTPLLTTKLPGIPLEYFEYVYTFQSESIEEIASDISRILSFPLDELICFGQKAKAFITENKNSVMQAKRILDFISLVVE